MKNTRDNEEDIDKLDWDLEAGDDMDFEDEFGYEDDEDPVDNEERSFWGGKNNNRKSK